MINVAQFERSDKDTENMFNTITPLIKKDYPIELYRLLDSVGAVLEKDVYDYSNVEFSENNKDSFKLFADNFMDNYLYYILQPKLVITLPLIKNDMSNIVYSLCQLKQNEIQYLKKCPISYVSDLRILYFDTKELDLFDTLNAKLHEIPYYEKDELDVFGKGIEVENLKHGTKLLTKYHDSIDKISELSSVLFENESCEMYFSNFLAINYQMHNMSRGIGRQKWENIYKNRDYTLSESDAFDVSEIRLLDVKSRRSIASRYIIYSLMKALKIDMGGFISYCLFSLNLEFKDIFLVLIEVCSLLFSNKKDYNMEIFKSKIKKSFVKYYMRCLRSDKWFASASSNYHNKVDNFIYKYNSDKIDRFINDFSTITFNKRFNILTYLFDKYDYPEKYNSNYYDNLDKLCIDYIRYYAVNNMIVRE